MSKKIRKRSGNQEPYSYEKILNGIEKAFKACGYKKADYSYDGGVNIKEEYFEKLFDVEEIRNKVEDILMNSKYKDVAKAYILYRNKRKEIKEYVKEKQEFINRYKKSSNTANATVDDNSNVGNKNVAVLNAEIHKSDNIQISRGMVTAKLRELFPDFDPKQYVKDLEHHIIYKHDESSFGGAIAPYTYSAKEVIEVMYNNYHLLVPFDLLFDIIEEPEFLVDSEKIVYQKYPDNLYVKDSDGSFVRTTHITKKKRHRDLYRIKTSFGEDIVVTDNHPMIINSNIDDTIPAANSLNCNQYKCNDTISFEGVDRIDLSDIFHKGEVYENFIRFDRHLIKRFMCLTEELGYVIGFFIGDGNYNNNTKYINFSQKDLGVLKKLNEYLYDCLGIAGYIKFDSSKNIYTLNVRSRALFIVLKDFFKIQDKAQGKTLPINILQFTPEFARGVLEGLYDADGTANYNQLWLKLSSRAAILQVSALMRYFGYTVGNGVQSLPFDNTGYKTNYTLWTIGSSKMPGCEEFNLSYKWKKISNTPKSFKYHKDGVAKITNVQKIKEEDSFLSQNDYIYDITTESKTFCLNNIKVHNCVSISMYPFLLNGIKGLGGLSAAPKNLDSYCGMFCNLLFAVSSQFAGAVACPEALLYFDYFARKEWGDDYYLRPDEVIGQSRIKTKTIQKQIHQHFQQIVYTINQTASGRNGQCPFTNFCYYDKPFFESMFENFVFPDMTKPQWESLNWLQKDFMKWFNAERLRCMMTFPVESFALIYKDGKFVDEENAEFVAQEWAEGHSFFLYISDTADSLSSCCRLRNKIQTKEFSFTNGNMGVETGSKSVITLNLSRIVQDWAKSTNEITNFVNTDEFYDSLTAYIKEILERVYKYHIAYNELLWDMYDANLLSAYKAGFISLNKQYLTLGVSGLNQAAEFFGIQCTDNEQYSEFCRRIFSAIKESNQEHNGKFNGHKLSFNTECVPAESLAIKNYNWDKADGYWVPEDTNLYASYIYKPNDNRVNILDKIRMHGNNYIGDYLDGGSSLHGNLSEHLSKEQYLHLMKYAAENGCSYLTWNVPNSECQDCGFITKVPVDKCPKCGSTHIDQYDRVIGYLTKISNWSEGRQIEQKTRVYSKDIE